MGDILLGAMMVLMIFIVCAFWLVSLWLVGSVVWNMIRGK